MSRQIAQVKYKKDLDRHSSSGDEKEETDQFLQERKIAEAGVWFPGTTTF